jgi:hypothetical protein
VNKAELELHDVSAHADGVTVRTVATADQLAAAAGDPAVLQIVVAGTIAPAPSMRLAAGQRLVGAGDGAVLAFVDGVDGVQLSSDNTVAGIELRVATDRRAIFNDTDVADLGTLRLSGLTTVGQVQILASDRVRAGHVVVDGLDIADADARGRVERPRLSGVAALQGAFTLWNLQPDPEAVLTAQLRGISAGRAGSPVRGTGVFVAGAAGAGGRLQVSELDTGAIFTDGGIPAGSHDTISAGVFVIYGARVERVCNRGPVTTYGVNDMVLDNWGAVDRWTAREPLTSYGPNGVGVVNFGRIGVLTVEAAIETHGTGARGFNVYRLDGHSGATVDTAEFHRITTHADAAVGIQIGQPVGRLVVRDGVHTAGGAGDSLVKGVITRLSPHALSVQPGGRIDRVDVGGSLTSAGADVATVAIAGEVASMRVAGGIHASGPGSDALHVAGGTLGLHDTDVAAGDGTAIRLVRATRVELRDVNARGARGDIVVVQS